MNTFINQLENKQNLDVLLDGSLMMLSGTPYPETK